jgi:hypothetical protein
MWTYGAGVVSVCLCLLCGSARAVDEANSEPARRHCESGTRAHNLSEFDHAADEFREVYRLHPDPVPLYNIAQAYRRDKNAVQALFFHPSYLRKSTEPPRSTEANDWNATLKEQLKQRTAPLSDVILVVDVGLGPGHGLPASAPSRSSGAFVLS